MRIKKFIALGLSLAIALGGVGFIPKKTVEVKAAPSYQLVWSDEFDQGGLDLNTWKCEVGTGEWGWGNNEQQYYTSRRRNLDVSNGTLKINALKENYGGMKYTSGRIITKGKKEFTYGRIEARMKLPSFSGAWPAFWMLGASGGWPHCGEIDIMEAINTENNVHGTLHWYVESADYNGRGDEGKSSAGKLPADYKRTEWHTYGIEWTETQIKWYVDDTVFLTQNISASHMSEFRKDQYIILNLAIGGQWPGYNIDDSAFPERSVMEVDYVRVYQLKEPTGETTTLNQGNTGSDAVNNDTIGSSSQDGSSSDVTSKVTYKKPKKPTIKKIIRKKKALTIQIKKVKKVDGYQIRYSTNKKFKNYKNKSTFYLKTTIKKLKSKKRYYVKVRSYYLNDDGRRVYSNFSKVKKAKTK